MFTIENIQATEAKIKSGADFPNFIQEIKAMGVIRNDVFVINGMAVYYGNDDHTVQSAPAYEDLLIEQESNVYELKEALKIHQNGTTDYQTFCRQVAAAGVEKWVIDLNAMTVTYLAADGTEMVVEHIPQA
jgi:uncharacterized protein YbcV (DUF1398 family)